MAVLAEEDRRDLWAQFMRENAEALGITKGDLRAAFNGADDYLDANAAAMNTAIPQPARAALSASQKAHIYQLVMGLRYRRGV
jgi:hypothetical protein